MKVAFICEGFSESDALHVLIPKLGLTGYDFLKHPHDQPQEGNDGIYRVNNKGVGNVLKRITGDDGKERSAFLIDANFLIYNRGFDKIVVWFDNDGVGPVCEQAKELRREIIELEGEDFSNKVVLIIANRMIENWYFSNRETFMELFDLDESNIEEDCQGILLSENVDQSNVKECLRAIDSYIDRSKQRVAMDFFGKFEPDADHKSPSFKRAIAKIRSIFI